MSGLIVNVDASVSLTCSKKLEIQPLSDSQALFWVPVCHAVQVFGHLVGFERPAVTYVPTSHLVDNKRAMMIVWRIRGKIVRTVCILYNVLQQCTVICTRMSHSYS